MNSHSRYQSTQGAVKAVNLFDTYIKEIMDKTKQYQPSAVKHPVLKKQEDFIVKSPFLNKVVVEHETDPLNEPKFANISVKSSNNKDLEALDSISLKAIESQDIIDPSRF